MVLLVGGGGFVCLVFVCMVNLGAEVTFVARLFQYFCFFYNLQRGVGIFWRGVSPLGGV